MKVNRNSLFASITCTAMFLLCISVDHVVSQKLQGVKTVMIDPGHGGSDPGTVYGNFKEKDINLKVALLLGDMITENLPDVKVLYTRKTDVQVDLYKRTEMANKAGADLFISLHVNAVDKGKTAPSGALTLVMGENQTGENLDVAMRENDVIFYEEDYTENYEGYVPGSAESFIIFSLMQYVYIDQSMNLANLMQQHYKKSTPLPDRGARQQNLLVLKRTSMPGVLTEMGFLSNAEDRKAITSDAGQRKIATALFNAVSEYKSRIEGRSLTVLLDASDGTPEMEPTPAGDMAELNAPEDRESKVVFRVQVCTSPRKLGNNSVELKPYKNMGITERKAGSGYKYCVGECVNYSDAVTLQKKVRKIKSDAFVVAFRGDEQISVSEARELSD